MITKKDNYNNAPVHYCKSCLSLNIKVVDLKEEPEDGSAKVSYCGKDGLTDIGTAHINEWKEMYKEKYGKDYLDEGVK